MTRLLFCVLALAPCALGQKLTAPADATVKVEKIFEHFNRTDSPGCAVGATIDGASVLSAAYGMADLEHGVALAADSVFEAGSISKQFTAASVLLLQQQGKLSLDDPIRKYIPEVPEYEAAITIRHMLNHTSGLRDWGSVAAIGGWPRTTRAYSNAHVLEIAGRQHALNYPPGAAYSYSNTGYNLAAILVGRVAGKPLAEFTREMIFTPLAMGSTEWRDDFQRIVHNRAIAYAPAGHGFHTLMPFENAHGNGGLLTTVGDLLRWNRNFTDPKVGGRALIDAQLQQGRLTDGSTIAYAAGLMVLHHDGLPEVSHSGSTAGYQAWLGRYPEQGLSVAVLCNVSAANGTQLGHQVADVFLSSVARPPTNVSHGPVHAGLYRSVRDGSVLTVDTNSNRPMEFETETRMRLKNDIDGGILYEKVERANPARAELEGMTGEYTSDEAEVTFQIAIEQDRLVIHRRPDATIPLTPTYRDGFSSSLGSVRFLRDAADRVTGLSIGESRVWDMRFRRTR